MKLSQWPRESTENWMAVSAMRKKCSKCNVTKSLELFPKRSTMRDGREGVCNACRCEHRQQSGYYLAERIRKYNYRAEKQAPVNLTIADLESLLSQENCTYCGENLPSSKRTIDHVYGLHDNYGGSNSVFNIVVCCRPCNTAKLNKHVYEFYRSSERFSDEQFTMFARFYTERLIGRSISDLEVEQVKINFADEAADLARNRAERQAII